MEIFEFIPQKNAKRLQLVTGVLILGGAAMLLLTFILAFPAEWTVQLLGVAMFALGIFVFSRYLIKDYEYASGITEDGLEDFTVTEITNAKKRVTVCRIAVTSIEEVFVVDQGDKPKDMQVKEAIRNGKYKKYNYCADLFDEKYICILATECGQPVAIKLSYGEELENYLGKKQIKKTEN